MNLYYLINFLGDEVSVSSDIFATYVGILQYVLDYDLKSEILYLDVLGGKFRCFYFIDVDSGLKIYIGFNNFEV